tara:strand:+ start:1233 stop:1781 length:549 start_codon:yes stop_codon:yes gene_type:complete
MASVTLVASFKRAGCNARVSTTAEYRRQALEILINEVGSAERLADLANTNAVYLSQIRNRARDTKTGREREMGSRMARKLEACMGKPAGWMDSPRELAEPMQAVLGGFSPAPAAPIPLRRINQLPGWPFPDLGPEAFEGLSHNDILEIQGRLRGLVEQYQALAAQRRSTEKGSRASATGGPT